MARNPMTLAQDTSRSDETSLRYAGWRVVLACFLIALFLFGLGLYGHGVYLAEVQRRNGWPAALWHQSRLLKGGALLYLAANRWRKP
jgi:Na+/proline symporter